MERHGYRSVVAQRMREAFEERSSERLQRAAEPVAPGKPRSLEEIRREARENWLRMRSGLEPEKPRDSSRENADDLSRDAGE
jgi:hypothetical protein